MRRALLPLAVLLAACSGGAGAADAGLDGGLSIAAPAAPAPPLLTPCPAGWREVADPDGVAVCDPWPATGMASCAADEAHFPGEPGCSRIGSACPPGEWPEVPPGAEPVLYVRAGGAAGGDGTMAAPFGTIAEALAVATPLTIVALGKGTYVEAAVVPADVTVWGACVAETIVAAPDFMMMAGTFGASGANATVRNLQIAGGRPGVVVFGNGRSLHLEDVLVAGATGIGITVAVNALITGHTVVVRDTAGRPPDNAFGRGVDAEAGGDLELSRAVIVANHDVGAYAAAAGSSMTLTDVAVLDTAVNLATGSAGYGVRVRTGASMTLSRVAVERSLSGSVAAEGPGTMLHLTDVVLRDALGDPLTGVYGEGIDIGDGAAGDVTRALLERHRESGVFVAGAASTLSLTDVIVRDTTPSAAGVAGRGMEVQYATVTLTRGLFVRNVGVAVLAAYGGTVTIDDLIVRDILAEPTTGDYGGALAAQSGPTMTVTRALIERTREVAVLASNLDTTGTNRPTTIRVTDVVVRDTGSNPLDGRFGRAVNAQDGATIELERALLERSRDVGVFAASAAVVRLLDVVVADTAEQECQATDTCGWRVTSAAGAYSGATIDARRFRFTRSALMGLQLADGGAADLHEGEVSGNAIGVNVQSEGFDTARLADQVVYVDNDVNLASEQLDVPAPTGP